MSRTQSDDNAHRLSHSAALSRTASRKNLILRLVILTAYSNADCIAVQELCIKPKNFKDLVDDTPFKREDIVTLQDPHAVDDEINTFYHIKMGLGKRAPEAIAADGGGLNATAVSGNGELSCSSSAVIARLLQG